jgi:hypothetical protein
VRAALNWSFSENGDPINPRRLGGSAAQFLSELNAADGVLPVDTAVPASLDKASADKRQEMTPASCARGLCDVNARQYRDGPVGLTRSLQLARELDDLHWQPMLLRGLHIYLTARRGFSRSPRNRRARREGRQKTK